jgi:hypothetical protein
MSGTSATGGYMLDVPPKPPSADDLQRALQTMATALSGIPGNLVRPRWQPMPPAQPDASVTWASIGVVHVEADDYPYIFHVGGVATPGSSTPGYDVMQRHMTITVIATFYGPECEDAASQMRDALYMNQNIWPLTQAAWLKLRTVEDLARAPELVNNQWIDRIDLRIQFRAQENRYYPVYDVAAAAVEIITDAHVDIETDEGAIMAEIEVLPDPGTTLFGEGGVSVATS